MTFADRFYFIVNNIPRLSRSSRIYQQSKDYFALYSRNHVFKVGGSNFLVWGITALFQKN